MKRKHLGTSFDSFLEEEGLLAQASTVATKRVIAYQIKQEMKKRNLAKSEFAKQTKTSRAALNVYSTPLMNLLPFTPSRKQPLPLAKKTRG